MKEVYNASIDFNFRSNTINFKYPNLHNTVANDDTLILCWRRWPKDVVPRTNMIEETGFVQFAEYDSSKASQAYRAGNNDDALTEEYQIGHFVVAGPKVFNRTLYCELGDTNCQVEYQFKGDKRFTNFVQLQPADNEQPCLDEARI